MPFKNRDAFGPPPFSRRPCLRRSGARYNRLVTTRNNGAVWYGYSALPPRLGKDEPEAEPMPYLTPASTAAIA